MGSLDGFTGWPVVTFLVGPPCSVPSVLSRLSCLFSDGVVREGISDEVSSSSVGGNVSLLVLVVHGRKLYRILVHERKYISIILMV